MLKLKKKRNQNKKQYSKVWMTRWQVFVMFWLSVFFVVDIVFNKAANLETLCITLVTSIIATMIPYFAKSYFETKQEKLMEFNEKVANVEMEGNEYEE